MKRIYKNLALGVVLTGSLASCNDFLTVDPVDKLTQDNFYTSEAMVRSNTMALYAAKTWDNFAHDFQWKFDMLGGDMFYTYQYEGQWYFGTYTAVNQYINQGWEGLYNVIAFCNSVIHDMPEKCQSGVPQSAIDQAIAEARCIRGYCYYMIAEIWHDAPIVENNSANITSGNLQLPRNTQANLYRFAMDDLDAAVEALPYSDSDAYRVNKYSAMAIRAKLAVTMASHSDYGYNRESLYEKAATDAKTVVEALPSVTEISYETLFDVEANNGPESLLAIQCGVLGYGYGNPRTVAWTRSSVIADECWGEGKGPTVSLQKMFTAEDKRRKWCYMTSGDYYPNLAKAQGGYTYNLITRGADGSKIEDKNQMNAHLKKYILGKSADCDGNVGLGQDGANNIYLMRLADCYFLYAEAVMGTATSTEDAVALSMVNTVRERAGLDPLTSITYEQLLCERRLEFAFEGINWFDILRYRYRVGDQKAIDFLNSGYGTDYNRCCMYVAKSGTVESNENNPAQYVIASSQAEGAEYDPIILTPSSFVVPLPAAATTSSPQLLAPPVDYYAQ